MSERGRAQGFARAVRIRMGSKIGSDTVVQPMEDTQGAWMPYVDTSGFSAGSALKRERSGRVMASGDGSTNPIDVPFASDLEVGEPVTAFDSDEIVSKVFGFARRD